ncbi:MAG: hypothetical protein IPP98_12920 [Gemmatimonadetes bacterium]|nr:hypothetical protein [Gemmatimonadota bacterium]
MLPFLRYVLDGLSISGIGLFLTETSMFKNHVEARLRRFGIVESATDPSVLANYSQRTIQRIELAAQTALLPSAGLPREIGDLLHSLQKLREGSTVWRTGYRYDIELVELPVECGMYQLKKSFELTFVNNSGRTTTHTQTIKLGKLGAHPKSDGKHKSEVTKLEIGGVDCLATAERADTEEMLVRNVTFDIPPESTPADRIRMRVEETTCYPTGMPWVLSMNTPTQGFELSFRFKGKLNPSLHIFGLGGSEKADPLDPKEKPDGYRLWKYDGWIAPRQGVVLSFGEIGAARVTNASRAPQKRNKRGRGRR